MNMNTQYENIEQNLDNRKMLGRPTGIYLVLLDVSSQVRVVWKYAIENPIFYSMAEKDKKYWMDLKKHLFITVIIMVWIAWNWLLYIQKSFSLHWKIPPYSFVFKFVPSYSLEQ